MYEYVGKASPFLVLAALGLFDGSESLLRCVERIERHALFGSVATDSTTTWCVW